MRLCDIKKLPIKHFLTLLILIGLTFTNCVSFAAGTAKVLTADEYIEKTSDNQYLIPVYISDNSGIMGFRVEFIFDMDQMSIDYISKGNVTKTGSFDSSIDTSGEFGRGTAIWYHTENVNGDGTICYLGVTLKEGYESSLIRVGYIQEDTFNESWQDVALDCYNIQIGNESEQQNNDSQNKEVSDSNNKSSEDSSNNTNNKNGTSDGNKKDDSYDSKKDISQIDSNDLVKKDYNNNEAPIVESSPGEVKLSEKTPANTDKESLKQIANSEEEKESKKSAQNEGASKVLTKNVSPDDIKDYVIKELISEGYDNINQIPEDKSEAFWSSVKNNYIKDHADNSSELVNSDFSVFKESLQITDADIKAAKANSSKKLIPIIIVIAFVVFAGVAVLIIKNKKKK